jgi:proteic killer suppression protein
VRQSSIVPDVGHLTPSTVLALDLGTTTGWALRPRDAQIAHGFAGYKPQRFEGGGMRYRFWLIPHWTRPSLAKCKDMPYTFTMIESFVHKGLEELFEKGKSAKVQKTLAERALRRLDAIDAAKTPEALNVPGFDFHGLQGKPKRYSMHVNGPWCITFEWQGENAMKLDFENYH